MVSAFYLERCCCNPLPLIPWPFSPIATTGVTYFYGYQPTWPICEADSDTKFRTLLRFDDLHNFISASFSSSQKSNVTVLESDVTMTFVNTQQEAKLEACFVTLPWDYDYEDNVRPK